MKKNIIKKPMKVFTTTLLNLAIIAISISLFACNINSVGVDEVAYKDQLKAPIGNDATSSYSYNTDSYNFTSVPNKNVNVRKFVFTDKVPFSSKIYNNNTTTSYGYSSSPYKSLNNAIDIKYLAPSASATPRDLDVLYMNRDLSTTNSHVGYKYTLDVLYINRDLSTWGNASLYTVITGGGEYYKKLVYDKTKAKQVFTETTGVGPTVNITAKFSDQGLAETIWNNDYPINYCNKPNTYMVFTVKFKSISTPFVPGIQAGMDLTCTSPGETY